MQKEFTNSIVSAANPRWDKQDEECNAQYKSTGEMLHKVIQESLLWLNVENERDCLLNFQAIQILARSNNCFPIIVTELV